MRSDFLLQISLILAVSPSNRIQREPNNVTSWFAQDPIGT